MKKVGLLGVAFSLVLLCCISCKSKQSAYKSAYEKAKEKEMTEKPVEEVVIAPVTKSKTVVTTRQEKIEPVAGETGNNIHLYSVIVGSFKNKTNAYSLKDRMLNEGYLPIVAANEHGMFRVILTSHDRRDQAERSRNSVRSKYSPNFQDAWILERTY